MDLVLFFRALKRRIWLLLVFPAIAIVASLVFTWNSDSLYLSESQLATGFTVNDQVTLGEERFNLRDSDVKFNNLIATLNSPLVINMVSYRLLLHDLESAKPFRTLKDGNYEQVSFENINMLRAKLTLEQKLDSIQLLNNYNVEERKLIDLIKAYEYGYATLAEKLAIKRIGFTDYVSVAFKSEDPYLSAFVVNTICSEFFRYSSSFRSKISVENIESLARLAEEKRRELTEKSRALQEFKSNQGVLNFDTESEFKIQEISTAEQEKRDEEKRISALELEIRALDKRLSELGTYNGEPSSNVNQEIVDLRNKIRDLNAKYAQSGYTDAQQKAELELLRSELKTKELLALPTNTGAATLQATREALQDRKRQLEVEISIAQGNLRKITNVLSRMRSTANSYASNEAIISNLQREVELATQEYQSIQEKYNTALNISMASSSTIKQSLIGQPPAEPEPSLRVVIAGLAGTSTLILCMLLILLTEYLDLSIRYPSIFERLVKLKMLGSVNFVSFGKGGIGSVFKQPSERKGAEIFREMIRKVRFEIRDSGGQIFLFTSTKEGEGKSTMIEALAHAFSIGKKSVLLIDTNFQHNSLTERFKANTTLESLLGGTYDASAVAAKITPTDIAQVDILGSKGGKYSPSEVILESSMQAFLADMKQRYDLIFMEGAPLNHNTDSKELIGYADKVVAVFAADSVIKQSDRESIAYLRDSIKNFGGSILNRVELENLDQ